MPNSLDQRQPSTLSTNPAATGFSSYGRLARSGAMAGCWAGRTYFPERRFRPMSESATNRTECASAAPRQGVLIRYPSLITSIAFAVGARAFLDANLRPAPRLAYRTVPRPKLKRSRMGTPHRISRCSAPPPPRQLARRSRLLPTRLPGGKGGQAGRARPCARPACESDSPDDAMSRKSRSVDQVG
jgi:hypothetical protein